jgi:N6-adenosine-specific RNA methylase IME4
MTSSIVTENFQDLIGQNYQLILADPPWLYYGDPNKDQAAGKHYNCMSLDELSSIPISEIRAKKSVIYIWSTGPKLKESIDLMQSWGYYYRTVAHVWIKISKSGNVINGQGVRPSFVKQNAEYILVGSTEQKGRTLTLESESIQQVVMHQRPGQVHSKKPDVFRDLIDETYGHIKKVELFCRYPAEGWDSWGNEAKTGPASFQTSKFKTPIEDMDFSDILF